MSATSTKERPILFTSAMAQKCHDGSKTQTRRVMKPQPVVSESKDSFEKASNDGDAVMLLGHYTCPPGFRRILEFRFDRWTMARLEFLRPAVSKRPTVRMVEREMERQGRRSGGDLDQQWWSEREVLGLCPYGQPGDRMWVRERYSFSKGWNGCAPSKVTSGEQVWYHADGSTSGGTQLASAFGRVRPNIHMPRWACRTVLEVVKVRVERVQDIGTDGRKAHDVLAEGITQDEIEHQRKFFHADDSPALAYAMLWESINGKGSWKANPWVWVIEFRRITQ